MTNKIQNDLRGNALLKYIKKKTVIINLADCGPSDWISKYTVNFIAFYFRSVRPLRCLSRKYLPLKMLMFGVDLNPVCSSLASLCVAPSTANHLKLFLKKLL